MLLLGRYLSLPSQLLNRHPFPLSSLAVRIICSGQQGGSQRPDIAETGKFRVLNCSVIYFVFVHCKNILVLFAVLNARVRSEELAFMKTFSTTYKFTPTLLPIKSVQGNSHVDYVVGLSENCKDQPPEPTITAKFEALTRMAKLIATVCPNVCRVCYIFGSSVKCPVDDITPTTLTPKVVELLRESEDILVGDN